MQPPLPTKIMIGVPSALAASMAERSARGGSSRANSSPTSRSAWTRPTLNLPSMPKNSCVSFIARQAWRSPSTSISESGRSTVSRCARRDGECRRRRSAMTRDQRIERRPVGLLGGVDLVHRLARAVEELQAEPLAALQGFAHGKAMLPASQEQAQVDVGPQHQAVRSGHLHVLEAAMALVHAMLVARQAHDAADRRHLRQDRPPVGGKRRRRGADAQSPPARPR